MGCWSVSFYVYNRGSIPVIFPFIEPFMHILQRVNKRVARSLLLRASAISIGVKFANMLLAFFLSVLLSRLLGPDGYGVYAFALALIALLAVPAQAGLPQLIVRETAKAYQCQDLALMRGLWRWSDRIVVAFSLIAVMFASIALWFGGNWFSADRWETLFVGLLLVPLIALNLTKSSALRGLGRVVLGQVPDNIIRPSLLILFVVIAMYLSPSQAASPRTVMFLHLLAGAGAFVLVMFLLKRVHPNVIRYYQVSREERARWRRAALPLALLAAIQVFNTQVDLVILGLLRNDSEVGVYRVVVQMGSLVVFGLVAINQVLHPHFAALYSTGDLARLQQFVTTSSRAILVMALVPTLLFLFKAKEILGFLFGAEFTIGADSLVILALGQLANAGFGSVGALLNMTGHEKDTMWGMIAAILVNVVLNLALIPHFGMVGAATATAISFVIWNAILWYYVRHRLGIESSSFGWCVRR